MISLQCCHLGEPASSTQTGFVDFRKASTVARRDEEGKEKEVEGGEYHDDWNSLQFPDEIVVTTSARGKHVLS